MSGPFGDPEANAARRALIRSERLRLGRTLVVLDDDPTGSQSVHGMPVITSWEPDDVAWAFEQPGDAFFVLTNTRSLPPEQTARLIAGVVDVIEEVAGRLGRPVDLVLRGDSTLRGHYPLESDLLARRAAEHGEPYRALLLVPAYLEAGRITVDDVHLVRRGDEYVPVADTDYASDATFGFASSDLRDYVVEKTAGGVPRSAVASLSLDDIRVGGAERVRDVIVAGRNAQPIVVNAAQAADLDVVAHGLLLAQAAGARVLVRTGPSFVASLLGLEKRAPLTQADVFRGGRRPGHGIVVVGSHVALTTAQVQRLRSQRAGLPVVELDVPRLLGAGWADEVQRATDAATAALAHGNVLLVTSRRRVDADDGAASLELARSVSRALVTVVAQAVRTVPVSWVIAKGGITSSDVATGALDIRRAEVLGQLFPGVVSVWSHRGGADAALEGLPYVVFAGNVGDESSLAEAVAILDPASG